MVFHFARRTARNFKGPSSFRNLISDHTLPQCSLRWKRRISPMCVVWSALSRPKDPLFVGGSPSSGNRDAEDGRPDSSPAGRTRTSRTTARRSPHTSFHVATSSAPCLIRVFGPKNSCLSHCQGQKNITILLKRASCRHTRAGIFRSLLVSAPGDVTRVC